jgi:hypothetical protein
MKTLFLGLAIQWKLIAEEIALESTPANWPKDQLARRVAPPASD